MNGSRQLAAIMFTDIVGYTAMMQHDEQKAVAVIKHYNATLEKWVKHFNGQILNYYGDGSLCTFSSATDAVTCSLELQKELQTAPVVPLRVGLHIGEIFFEEEKALGDGVNVASRVQSLGQENTILISGEVYDKIKNNPSISAVSLGLFDFKNVDKPLEVFSVTNEGLFVPLRKNLEGKLKNKNLLKKKVIATLFVLVLIAGTFLIYKKVLSKRADVKIDKSIAVLPFVDMSANKDQEYFSDGLSEELLNLLSKIPELKVIGRTSSFSFKGKNEDLRIIGEKLGVANILEGSVQKEGNKIRVTAQLIRTADGFHLWSEKYDRDLEGIFQLQDEIAGAVVNQLKLKLLNPTVGANSINKEVYNLILQGEYFTARRDKESLAKAHEFLLDALAIDSLNARSWASLAECYNLQANWGWIDRNQGYEKAKQAAIKSIALNSSQAKGHRVLGSVKMHDYDWAGAENDFKKALDLEPQNAEVLRIFGFLYRSVGRFDEAIQLTKQSIVVDPVQAITYFNYGQLLYQSNHPQEAIASYKKLLDINPQFPRAHIFLGKVYMLQGKPELALSEMSQEANEAWKNFGLILVYQALDRKKEADSLLTDYLRRFQNDNAYQLAEIYAARGEKDKGFEYLEKAYIDRESRLVYLKGDPLLKNLQQDPRYISFLKKMKLPAD